MFWLYEIGGRPSLPLTEYYYYSFETNPSKLIKVHTKPTDSKKIFTKFTKYYI